MAKRFTETVKWADPWFRGLPPLHKLGWVYLCDNCNIAGIVDLDNELADFQIGDTVDWPALINVADERIVQLNCGKLWLSKFVSFQYGELSEECRPHQSVLQILGKYAETEAAIEGYLKGLPTLKDKDKDKDKDKKGDARGKQKRIDASAVPMPESLDTPKARQALADWIDYKAQRGQAYKDASYIGRKVKEYAAAGPAAFIAAVDSSIGNSYSGLFPAKDIHGNSSKSRVGPGQRFQG